MAGYTVGINSETRAFKQGIQSGVIEPLEDAQKELVDLGKSKGPDQLEKSLKDAQKATERLADETKDTARIIEQEYRDAYRKAKQSSDDGLGKMKEAGKEVTQEIGQNLGEAVSSVRGNLADLGQVGQDTLGGLASTLAGVGGVGGIAGAAAVAAGAVGLGLVTAELTKQQEEADKLRDRLAGAYRTAMEEGRNYLDTAQVIAEGNDLMFNPDRAEEWKSLQKEANDLGLSNADMIKASAGDLDAIAVVQNRYNDLIDAEGEKRSTTNRLGSEFHKNEEERLSGLRDKWNGAADASRDYANRVEEASRMASDRWKAEISALGDVAVEVDAVGNKVIELPDGKKILIDAQTGQATDNVTKFKGDADGVIDHINGKEVVIKATADVSQARRDLEQFIADNANRTIAIGAMVGGVVGRNIP